MKLDYEEAYHQRYINQRPLIEDALVPPSCGQELVLRYLLERLSSIEDHLRELVYLTRSAQQTDEPYSRD